MQVYSGNDTGNVREMVQVYSGNDADLFGN